MLARIVAEMTACEDSDAFEDRERRAAWGLSWLRRSGVVKVSALIMSVRLSGKEDSRRTTGGGDIAGS